MTGSLFFEAITKILLGFLVMALLIFLPAGTVSYWNGWLLLGLLFVPMLIAGVVLMVKNPKLLARRLQGKESGKEQSFVVKLSGLMFVLGFVVAGLDFRFGWTPLGKPVVMIASLVFLFSYLLYAKVISQNEYLSRTIGVEEGQRVVDTGLYGMIRHPMYLATVFLFWTMPWILGSFYAFLPFLFYPFLIAKRIRHEESFLEKELPGYREYQKKVRYRLIPYVW